MKTQYYGATSLDGFIADENHSLDWLTHDAAPEESSYPDFIRDVGAITMGATTYLWVHRHLAAMEKEEERRWPYDQPCWIFTHRDLPAQPGATLHFVQGDVRGPHAAMVEAAAGKNVWIAGGGDLAGQFHDQGLLDELILQIAPATLGSGAPLLPRRIALPGLRLTSVQRYGSGFVEVRYDVPRPNG